MVVQSLARFLLIGNLLFFCLYASGQAPSDTVTVIQPGNYQLYEIILNLRSAGKSISFSSDKIRDVSVVINEPISFQDLLQKLNEDRLLNFKIVDEQVLLFPYEEKKYTLHGVLIDKETGEQIIGATIQIEGSSNGTVTNGYGYYSLTLPEGKYLVTISHITYKKTTESINLRSNIYQKISLTPSLTELGEIQVDNEPANYNVISPIPSVSRINIADKSETIPYLGGEVDIIQNALLQPGIKSIGEDANGVNIRGGAVDQNLNLIDEAVAYNPNHFFGLISIFNPEAINHVRILKGYIPPSYGGRASAVIEVRQKEGNSKNFGASGGVGLPSIRMMAEGPFRKGKSSFLVSARQSLIIPSIEDFGNTSVTRNRYLFQDVNLKINSKPNPQNTYYLSGYYGNDRNTVGLSSVRNWGNRLANFRWNHLFSPKIFSNLSTYITEYSYKTENEESPGAFVGTSRIVDYSLKADINYFINPKNEIGIGTNVIFHRLNPGLREPLNPDTNTTNTIELDREHAFESAVYLKHDVSLNTFSLNYGLRFSLFHNVGASQVFLYKPGQELSDTSIIDTVTYSKNEIVKIYRNLEPRIAINYLINDELALKFSYSKTAQYLHLLSNTVSPTPTDTWKLSDTHIPPTITHQYTLGAYQNILNNNWEFSTELYYKDIINNIQYKSGADLVFNENIETELLFTSGRAYGLELFAKKRTGNLKGWISYTLSRAESRLIENNRPNYVLENHDRLHDFSTSWNYRINNRISVSSNFVFLTGIPVTLPSDKYIFEGNLIPHFTERNTERLPNYHRLDFSLQLAGKTTNKYGEKRKNQDYWVFTLYNVYARKNAFSYFYRESVNNPGLGEVVQYSIFGTIIPSITYNFKF